MDAEDLGQKLLAEVQQLGLSEVLSILHQDRKAAFGIRPLDALYEVVNASRPQTAASRARVPFLEIASSGPAAGKSHLLYYLIAVAVLPLEYNGKQSSVIIVDTNGKFAVDRLAQELHLLANTEKEESALDLELNDDVIVAALKHVHVVQTESASSTLAAIEALPQYLFDADAYHSFDRPLAFIAIDSISSFYWQWRLNAEEWNTTSMKAAIRSVQPSEDFVRLGATLNRIAKTLHCSIITLSTHMGKLQSNRSSAAPDSRSLRPMHASVWPMTPTLRLLVNRTPVPKLPTGMSLQDAMRDLSERQNNFKGAKFAVYVNEWDLDERLIHRIRETRAGFQLQIGPQGVVLLE